jgi:hypothetical protein
MDPDPDADPDSAIFVTDLHDANEKQTFLKVFVFFYFFKVQLHNFQSQKKSQSSSNKGFSYYFCLVIKGSGPDPNL